MTPVLAIEVTSTPLERVPAELAVAYLFEGDRPLRGGAGRADWRLCGGLSELLLEGRFRGERGEAVLIPTYDRLRAPRFLLLGLGAEDRFGPSDCASASFDAVCRAHDLGLRSLVLSPAGDWSVRIPPGVGAQAVVRGAVAALVERPAELRLRIVAPAERLGRVRRGLETAAEQLGDVAVEIRLPAREHPVASAGRRPRTAGSA